MARAAQETEEFKKTAKKYKNSAVAGYSELISKFHQDFCY